VELPPREGAARPASGAINLGFIGAGSYAQNFLLPILAKDPRVNFRGVATTTGGNASHVGKKYQFAYISTDPEEILSDEKTDVVFIATRHNSHADFAVKALEAGKQVFVEKPLAINPEQLETVISAWKANDRQLMLGFNRRFSPLVVQIKDFFKKRKDPLAINYRINAGFVEKSHWVQDPETGGGRIIGEVCHFVDLCSYLTGSSPKRLFAQSVRSGREDTTDNDTVAITISYQDGSLATVLYLANGDKSYPKEHLEVYGENSVAVLNDYRELQLVSKGKTKRTKLHKRDKGQANELRLFMDSMKKGKEPPIPFAEIVSSTRLSFKVLESLRTKEVLEIDDVL